MSGLESRQVQWWTVLTWVQQLAAQHGVNVITDNLPLPGTPTWCGLPDGDARKLCAVLLAGAREALNHDTHQAALADASREIASAATWSTVSRGRGDAYIPRRRSA